MKKTIEIEGMMCEGCSGAVVEALEKLDAVVSAEADHKTGLAVVELGSDVANEVLEEVIEELEFVVNDIR